MEINIDRAIAWEIKCNQCCQSLLFLPKSNPRKSLDFQTELLCNVYTYIFPVYLFNVFCKWHNLLSEMQFTEIRAINFFQKSKTHALRRSIHCFFESRKLTLFRKKGKLHDILTDKMLFVEKKRDYFSCRKSKCTLCRGWFPSFSKAEELK